MRGATLLLVGTALVGGVLASAARASDAAASPAPPPLVVDAADGPLEVGLELRPARPAIGAPVRLRLSARLSDPSLVVEWPKVAEVLTESLGELVIEVESMRPTPDGRGVEGVFRLFDEGEHALPALTVRAVRPAAPGAPEPVAEAVLEGAVLRVEVDVAADAEPAGPLAPLPLTVPDPPFPWLWAGAAAALVALLAAALVAYLRRARPLPAPEPPAPPHQRALDALARLRERHLPERGEVEPYFVELSEILRRYLEERFGLRAPEQTTEEFLATVSNTEAGRRAIESAHRDLLRDFLTRADLVKFARETPGAEDCEEAGAGAERFVRDTIPEERPAVEATP
jgi:hypothetical protein